MPAADVCLAGGRIADVRAGALRRAAVAISAGRVTAVGPEAEVCAGARQILDVSGRIVAPGYVEPHTHAVLAAPVELTGALLRHGTTTAVVDALPFIMLATPDRLPSVLEGLAALPVKFHWLIRLHPPSFSAADRFSLDRLRRLWRLPSAAAVGEVTRWTDVHDGRPDLLAKIAAARADGRRVEGHAPGASYDKLAVLAAAGFSSCHEAVTAEEVRDRLRVGLYVMLRHSPIRPDLPQLAAAVTAELASSPRLMFTADGPSPVFIEDDGYMDHVIAVAIRSGIPPLTALRLATLNPAAYYGMGDRGEIVPGKRADLNVLRDLADPYPEAVIVDGQVAVRGGRLLRPLPDFTWDGVFEPLPVPRVPAEAFAVAPARPVVCRLINDVITEPLAGDSPAAALQAVLIDRNGHWLTRCLLTGFVDRLGGLATTVNTAFDLLVVGQNVADMARAAERVADLGGGLVVVDQGAEIFTLPLDLGGIFSSRPWAEVVEADRRFIALMRSRGFRFTDPLFSLMFLTFDSLPWIRLTSRGVWDVRQRRVLDPATAL